MLPVANDKFNGSTYDVIDGAFLFFCVVGVASVEDGLPTGEFVSCL